MQEKICEILAKVSSEKIFFHFCSFFHSLFLSNLGESKISFFFCSGVSKKQELANLPSTLVFFISLVYKKSVIDLALRNLYYYYYYYYYYY